MLRLPAAEEVPALARRGRANSLFLSSLRLFVETLGPLARTVDDLRLLYVTLSGSDAPDRAKVELETRSPDGRRS